MISVTHRIALLKRVEWVPAVGIMNPKNPPVMLTTHKATELICASHFVFFFLGRAGENGTAYMSLSLWSWMRPPPPTIVYPSPRQQTETRIDTAWTLTSALV